jgi:molybdopterin-containing oxidoreductase family iron-sulfur binding subunit
LCQWHIPEAHFLETWSDARAYDGTATIMQPLIMPLYFGRSVHELLAAFGDQPNQTPYEIVKAYWNRQHPGADFEDWWRKAVHDGIVPALLSPPARSDSRPPSRARPPRPQSRHRLRASKSCSAPTRLFSTAASPTTAGFRNCPGR